MSTKEDRENTVPTELGWAIESETPPMRKDLFWKQKSSGDIYYWIGDGWERFLPPERPVYKDGYLDHG